MDANCVCVVSKQKQQQHHRIKYRDKTVKKNIYWVNKASSRNVKEIKSICVA